MNHALKEWAVICRALADGRQALLLRKGGIAETDGDFRLEHDRFWFFPTYVHQQRTGTRPEAYPLLEQAEAERPPPGTVRMSHFGEVGGVYFRQSIDDPAVTEIVFIDGEGLDFSSSMAKNVERIFFKAALNCWSSLSNIGGRPIDACRSLGPTNTTSIPGTARIASMFATASTCSAITTTRISSLALA